LSTLTKTCPVVLLDKTKKVYTGYFILQLAAFANRVGMETIATCLAFPVSMATTAAKCARADTAPLATE